MPLIERFGGRQKRPSNRPLCENESYRWIEGMQTSATVLNAAAQVTVVADREGDIFEMFACRSEDMEVLEPES